MKKKVILYSTVISIVLIQLESKFYEKRLLKLEQMVLKKCEALDRARAEMENDALVGDLD